MPHSETCGSKIALISPQLVAECHVLLRLLMPRHPPNALKALDPLKIPIRADRKQRVNSHSLKTKFHTYSHCQTTKRPYMTHPQKNRETQNQNLMIKPYPPQNKWWRRTESNRRPPACKAGALPTELRPQISNKKYGGPGKT